MVKITPEEIELLNGYFSTKSLSGVQLGCERESEHTLLASVTNPPIRYAISSLKALREDLESTGNIPASVVKQTPSYIYSLQQYCMALRGLTSGATPADSDRLKSALLCCQIFISIEQLQGNYVTMAQHVTQGLRILHDSRARPTLATAHNLLPATHDRLPSLDVFIIKLFAAPCKFSDTQGTANVSAQTASASLALVQRQSLKPSNLRRIAPDMRTELTRTATSTLHFLNKVLHVESAAKAHQLLLQKAVLQDYLELWLLDLEFFVAEMEPLGPERLSVSFMRLFHQILVIVLLGVLDSSSDFYAKLQIETERLQVISSIVGEGLRLYNADSNTRNR